MRAWLLLPALLLCCCGKNSGPEPGCGNGVVAGTEQCDGQDLSGQTCLLAGYLGGNLGCNTDCTFDFGGCTDPSDYYATWNSACGNAVCEIDEASSTCPSDCGARTVTEKPFAIHAANPVQANELSADLRAFVRLEALTDLQKSLPVADAAASQTSTRIIVTLVSGAEVLESGFRYCLPTGATLDSWRQFVGRMVER